MPTNSFYNKIAPDFNATRSHIWWDWEAWEKYFTNYFDELWSNQPGKNIKLRILDLGCGNGRLIPWLERKLAIENSLETEKRKLEIEYFGVDNSSELIKHAKDSIKSINSISIGDFKPTRFQFINSNLLDFEDHGSFDFIFSIAVLHHLEVKDQPKFWQKIDELLKPGGRAIVTSWNILGRDFRKRSWSTLGSNIKNYWRPLLTTKKIKEAQRAQRHWRELEISWHRNEELLGHRLVTVVPRPRLPQELKMVDSFFTSKSGERLRGLRGRYLGRNQVWVVEKIRLETG